MQLKQKQTIVVHLPVAVRTKHCYIVFAVDFNNWRGQVEFAHGLEMADFNVPVIAAPFADFYVAVESFCVFPDSAISAGQVAFANHLTKRFGLNLLRIPTLGAINISVRDGSLALLALTGQVFLPFGGRSVAISGRTTSRAKVVGILSDFTHLL
ncbi:MAG: hypothetical protein KME26_10685 [Oscillatoria princeps RMCB-10]|nr:hypothetical protein [Oscillatoria princeps RMCB-10]